MSEALFPKGYKNMPNRMTDEEIAAHFDRDRREWIDKDCKPDSCYVCPFSVWYSDYKRCTVLKQQLHPYFRINARLKACPIRIEGLDNG